MRFIVLLLLIFVVFNSMLLLTKPYFPDSVGGIDTKDITNDPNAEKYKNVNEGMITDIIVTSLSIIGVTSIIGVFAAKLITNFPTGLFIGAGSIIGIVMGVWSGYSNPFQSIAETQGLMNWYNFFIIIFGIIAVLSIIEIFTPKGDLT